MRKFDFSKPYNTIHNVTPFDQIQVSDYEPGIMQGIKEEDDEIESIINNPDIPTFENTIEALEKTGQTLHRVTNVFFNLLSCETNDEMEEIAKLDKEKRYYNRTDAQLIQFAGWRPQFEIA